MALFLLALSCLSTTSIFDQQQQQNQALAKQYRTG
jgi:type II secretory pathway component PulJ